MHVRVCDFAAGTNEAEGDGDTGGVGEVMKQLEQQALEDKEKEEDGEEGAVCQALPNSPRPYSITLTPATARHHHQPNHHC